MVLGPTCLGPQPFLFIVTWEVVYNMFLNLEVDSHRTVALAPSLPPTLHPGRGKLHAPPASPGPSGSGEARVGKLTKKASASSCPLQRQNWGV